MAYTKICPLCGGADAVNRERLGSPVVEVDIGRHGWFGMGWVMALGSGLNDNPITEPYDPGKIERSIVQINAV